MNYSLESLERIDWDKNAGLIPAIVQDARSARVLMLGYMNREALRLTRLFRPELLESAELSKQDQAFLEEEADL